MVKGLMEQAEAVYRILSSVYAQSPWQLEQIKSDLEQETTDYFFVYLDGQPVAFMALLHLIGESELTNLAVHADYQGRGFAGQLLSKLEELPQPIFLEVRASNHKAQHLYQKFGFEVLGCRKQYYHQPTEDALIMRKEA